MIWKIGFGTPKTNSKLLEERDVSTESISEILISAGYSVVDLEPTKFCVISEEIPFPLRVVVDDYLKIIKFVNVNKISDSDKSDVIAACNEINRCNTSSSYCVTNYDDEVRAVFESRITYEGGLIKDQIILNFEQFKKIVVIAFNEFLSNYRC